MRVWFRPSVLVLFCLAGWAASAAAEPLPLGLGQAVACALANGDEARLAELMREQAEHRAGQARAALLPQLTVTSGAGYSSRQTEKLRAVDRRGVERVYGLATLGAREGWFNVFLEQLLFDLSQMKAAEIARLEARVAALRARERREAVAQAIVELYGRTLWLGERRRLLGEIAERLQSLAATASALAKAGRTLELEREAVAIELERVRIELEELAALEQSSARALAEAVGLSGAEVRVLPASLPPPVVLPLPDDLEAALEETPEIAALDVRRQVERLRVEAAKAGRWPTVGVRAGYANYGTNRYDNFPDEWMIGLDVRVPLFDGLRSREAAGAASNGEQMARIEYKLALDRKRRRVEEEAAHLRARVEGERLAQRVAANARRRLELSELRLQAARASLGEVLDAQVRYRQASLAVADARLERLRAWAVLARELGRLSRAALSAAAPSAQAAATGPDGGRCRCSCRGRATD